MTARTTLTDAEKLAATRRVLDETQARLSVILGIVGTAPPFFCEETLLVSRVAMDAQNAISTYLWDEEDDEREAKVAWQATKVAEVRQ